MKTLVSIYNSRKREEMYLYVKKGADLQQTVPVKLLEALGTALPVFDLLLTPERKLARAEASEVLRAIDEQGFFLQMPPAELERDEYAVTLPGEFLCFNDPQ